MTNWALLKLHGQMGSTCYRNFAELLYNSLCLLLFSLPPPILLTILYWLYSHLNLL